MRQQGENRHVGVSKLVMLELFNVSTVDGGDKLGAQTAFRLHEQSIFGFARIVRPIEGSDLRSSGPACTSLVDRDGSRMDERREDMASVVKIFLRGEEQS